MSKMNIGKAIILSAGQGRRLSPLTDTRPKCLIELSGKSVLHWPCCTWKAAGLKEVVVVTGFRADAVEDEIARLALPDDGPHAVQPVLWPDRQLGDLLAGA